MLGSEKIPHHRTDLSVVAQWVEKFKDLYPLCDQGTKINDMKEVLDDVEEKFQQVVGAVSLGVRKEMMDTFVGLRDGSKTLQDLPQEEAGRMAHELVEVGRCILSTMGSRFAGCYGAGDVVGEDEDLEARWNELKDAAKSGFQNKKASFKDRLDSLLGLIRHFDPLPEWINNKDDKSFNAMFSSSDKKKSGRMFVRQGLQQIHFCFTQHHQGDYAAMEMWMSTSTSWFGRVI